MSNKKILQICGCLIAATVLALTTHIYVSEWTKPVVSSMMQDLHADPSYYPPIIISAAYGTAFLTVGLLVFLYYHTQHFFPVKSNRSKAFLAACVVLEIKGDLIRQPIMDILLNYTLGMKNPFLFVALNQADKWLSNLFLAVCLVYLCPKKQEKQRITPKPRYFQV